MAKKFSVAGIFEYLDDVLGAIETLKERGIRIETVYTPVPRHEIREALGMSVLSRVRFFTLVGGIIGIATGIFLAWYTSAQWNFIVGGKPVIPIYPAVIPAFEFLILISVLFNLGGMLFMSGLPRLRRSPEYDPRFSQDRFGIVVICTGDQCAAVRELFELSGSEEVHVFSR